MANKFQRLLREIREARKRRKDRPTLDTDADGFVFTRRRKPVSLKWDDVTEIAAGTLAIFSGEIFYAAISGGGLRLEIDEFVDGFNNFEAALFRHFPSVRTRFTALQIEPAGGDRLEVLWKSGDPR